MMQFDSYRWEDHRARAQRWKLDLAVTAISVGLLFGVGHEVTNDDFKPSSSVASQRPSEMPQTAMDNSKTEATARRLEETTQGAIYPVVVDIDDLGVALCDLSHSLDRATIRLRNWVSGTSRVEKEPQA